MAFGKRRTFGPEDERRAQGGGGFRCTPLYLWPATREALRDPGAWLAEALAIAARTFGEAGDGIRVAEEAYLSLLAKGVGVAMWSPYWFPRRHDKGPHNQLKPSLSTLATLTVSARPGPVG